MSFRPVCPLPSRTTGTSTTSAFVSRWISFATRLKTQPVLDRELQMFLDQAGKLRTEETKLTEQRQNFEADQSRRQTLVEESAARQQSLAEELKQIGEALTAERVLLGQIQEKQLASQQ